MPTISCWPLRLLPVHLESCAEAEVTQVRAGMVVMQALFEQRKRKFIQQMEEDKAMPTGEKVCERLVGESAGKKASGDQVRSSFFNHLCS